MRHADFQRALEAPEPPDAAPELVALWHLARGEWDAAHGLVQDRAGADAAWVHALVHRIEGDAANAGYWYRRAGRPVAEDGFAAERERIARALTDE
jgi:hypothetical protein